MTAKVVFWPSHTYVHALLALTCMCMHSLCTHAQRGGDRGGERTGERGKEMERLGICIL